MTLTFDDYADGYDQAFRDRHHRAEDAAVRRLIRPWITGADVLDVGCGTGLGLTMGEPRSYLGIDPCPRMIARANARWWPGHEDAHDGLQWITPMDAGPDFIRCPAEALAPPPMSYDTVLCLWSWPYLDDPAECLKHWHRCLRANGSVIIVSWDERYTPTIPVADAPARIEEVAALAVRMGFVPWTLGGLRRGVWTRALARALPVAFGSRLVETGPEAPAWVMRLGRPQIGSEPAGLFHHRDHGLTPPRRMDLARETLRRQPMLGWPEGPTLMPERIAPPGARRLVPLYADGIHQGLGKIIGWTTEPPPVNRPVGLGPDRTWGGP